MDLVNFVLQDRCTVSRRIKKRYSPLLIQERLKPMLLCIDSSSEVVSYYAMGAVGIRFFLLNVGARRDLDAMLSDAASTILPERRKLQKTCF